MGHEDLVGIRLRRVLGVCALTVWTLLAIAGEAGIEYQDRGDRREGVRPRPVSAGAIELISAQVDYREPVLGMPDTLKIRFYLREASDVYVTVRELEYRHYYWLDQVRPRAPWRAGYDNLFEWPTRDVLQKLTGLAPYELGVVARVGKAEEMAHERVAPVLLYHREAPRAVTAYLFTARTNTPATLNCTVYPAGADRSIFRQSLRLVHAGSVFTCRWDAGAAAEGGYRLVISGYSLDTNDAINKVVDFYHQPVLR